ncbi:hypothetical protein AG1IA_10318 [Rhizoctonia solani AG-1 IA]|uniref:Uncharacterized protein n=1 Tax=Thanatephorus cucumeris (strain AG1-IA) TaxID=983506 RepID=L8WG03_THACA|nr:hypothetical protein AG1IA_10318 [Rhizoctonia solani AG-1 IA]
MPVCLSEATFTASIFPVFGDPFQRYSLRNIRKPTRYFLLGGIRKFFRTRYRAATMLQVGTSLLACYRSLMRR